MNIVFWSECQGRCATSGNMLAVSIMSSLVYSVKGIVVQFDNCSKAIDDVFEGKRPTNFLMEEYAYYGRKGIDDLLDKSQLKEIEVADIRSNIIPVKNTCISYLPVSKRTKSGLSDREVIASSKRIMELLNEAGGYNFIDCVNGERSVTKNIIANADIVVVNICQGMNVDKLMISEQVKKKAVFLVGKYDAQSNENLTSICKKYDISRESIVAIPYNIEFHDAMQEGRLVSFLTKQIMSRRTDSNFAFINGVFKATDMILRKAGYRDE